MAHLKPFLKQKNVFKSKSSVKGNLSSLPEDVERYFSLVYVWKIQDVNIKLTAEVVECESDVFPCAGYSFKAKTQLKSKKDEENLYISLVLQTTSALRFVSAEVGLDVVPRVTYVVKDRMQEAEVVEDMFRSHNQTYRRALKYGRAEFELELAPRDVLFSRKYTSEEEDSVVIEVHLEPKVLSHQLFSSEGSVTWKVERYEQRKLMAQRGLRHFLPSPYFYTGPKGCRAYVELHLDGYGESKGQRLTAVLRFLSGRFDYYVETYVKQTIVFVLFNCADSNKNIVKLFRGKVDRKAEMVIDLASQEEIAEGGFVVNDVLMYKLIVDSDEGNINTIMYNVMAQPTIL